MKNKQTLILTLFLMGLWLGGCSHTLQEKKETSSDTGNITQLKFTGSKLKLEHDF